MKSKDYFMESNDMTEQWVKKAAKEMDENGWYTYQGMKQMIVNWFNLEKIMDLLGGHCIAVQYILETYLECYDNDWDFPEYLDNCRIWTEDDLKEEFKDIWEHCITYEGFCEYMDYFYPENEGMFWPWEYGVYSTQVAQDFEKNRQKINWTGVLMECERLITMMEYEEKHGIEITQNDLNKVAEVIAEYGYDINGDYDYDTAWDMLERYNQVFGGII